MVFKVLATDGLAEEATKIFEQEQGFELTVKKGMSEEELLREVAEYDALIVRSATRVNKKVLEAGKKLKAIGRAGTGVDNIDVEEATKKGIAVMNTPSGNTLSVAELTIAMILAMNRNVSAADSSMGNEIFGKTLGIVGLGRIGSEVAKRASAFGMNVIAFDPFAAEEKAKEVGVQLREMDAVLQQSDIITLHVPLNEQTKHLIEEKAFAKMKKGVQIVNIARGGIVKEQALQKAIEEGIVAGAAIDVWETEPNENSALAKMPQVLATPHLGAATSEATVRAGKEIAADVIRALKGEEVVNRINPQKR